MASLSDVENALGALAGATLYPSGASGEAASPVAGMPVLVKPGWPSAQSVMDMMVAGKAMVTIYPRPAERNTTRYQDETVEQPLPAATYTLARAGQVITVGGVGPSPYRPQNLAVLANGGYFPITAQAGQDAATLAAALQALIVVSITGTTVAGANITLPAGARIDALRVGVVGSVISEVRRQERHFQISIWAPTPAARAAVADPVDVAMARTRFLTLADGSGGRLLYQGTVENDFDQKQGVWRRDLIYSVEYGTTAVDAAPQIVATEVDVATVQGDPIATIVN